MTISTTEDVKSAAELERQRRAREAARARERAESQAEKAKAETEAQARRAISETERQAQAARAEVAEEAEAKQAKIRKQRGKAEKEAQAAKSAARAAKRKEARKVVLPFTKPKDLGMSSYINSVEAARKQAQKAGEDARATVTKIRDEYFEQVDEAKAEAIADINKQKAGIVKDIQKQLASYNADLTKQIAKLNSGIADWEEEATAAINKAQDEYEAAIQEQLNRPGTEVFADMKGQGLIPADAVYESYDKTTGQLSYRVPDTRTGAEIFAAEQAVGNIPDNATYKDYDKSTGTLTYTVPKRSQPETATNTTGPGADSTNVVNAAGGIAMASAAVMTLQSTGAAVATVPTPPTWAVGGALLLAAAIVAWVHRDRIISTIRSVTGKDEGAAASGAVVTNKAGTTAYTTAQIRIIPQEKGAGLETFPYTPPAKDMPQQQRADVPALPGFGLTAERFEVPGLPQIREPADVVIRDTFDVPELRQKGSNVMHAAAAVQAAANQVGNIAVKELGISRTQYDKLWEQVNEHLRQKRMAEGRKIIEDLAKSKDDVSISKYLKRAYEEYLRKKAILEAARKAYVASLNPQPVKGKGSSEGMAAATGIFLAQDIIQSSISKALSQGQSLSSAMETAQNHIQSVAGELGLSKQQINAANAAVVYDLALQNLTQEAIKTSSIGQTEGWTDTELQTKTFTSTENAINTIVQTAVDTGTLTRTQANSITQELTRAAKQVVTLTSKIKLPKPSTKATAKAAKERYPDGTIVWNQGSLEGKGDQYKIIPPPYTLDKPITSFTPPKGMKKAKGTPQETLTFIGGKVPFKNVSFDLGVTDGFIDVKSKTINFTGEGEKTNVGTRRASTTKGISLTDNPSLLQQLSKPRAQRRGKKAKDSNVRLSSSADTKKRRPASRGVYADRKGSRITRKHHKGWKRIY